MIVLVYVIGLLQISESQDISAITDLETLSELPLGKLLKLKHNFDSPEKAFDNTVTAELETKSDGPEALALRSKRKQYQREDSESDYYGKKDYKKDASTIFQMSVTTLSFVAFGGYLLCLIVQAIRAKNSMAATDTMAMLVRPGRPTRIRNPQNQGRPGSRYKRDVWPDVNPEGMYDALIMLAEGYSKYHSVDYKYFNQSVKSFI